MVVVGPGIGGLLLLTGQPTIGVAINAASFLVAAALVARLRVRSTGSAAEEGNALQQFAVGLKALGAQPVALAIILFCALDSAVYGATSVLYAPLSIRLGTGANGYSYLLAGAALGGVLGAGLANRLSSASRLAPVIMGSICLQALPFLVTIPVRSPALACALQVVSGVGMVIVDVLALTSLQRDLSGDVLSRVLGVFDTLVLGGILLASLATGILLAHADLNVALIAVGLGIPVIALTGLPTLLRADRTSAAVAARLRPRVELLSRLDLLAGADHNTLERLAAAGRGGHPARGQRGDPRGRRARRAVDPGAGRAVGERRGRRRRAPRAAAGDRTRLCRGARAPARHPPHRHGAYPRGKHAAADRRPGVPVRAADQPAKRLDAVGGRDAHGPHSGARCASPARRRGGRVHGSHDAARQPRGAAARTRRAGHLAGPGRAPGRHRRAAALADRDGATAVRRGGLLAGPAQRRRLGADLHHRRGRGRRRRDGHAHFVVARHRRLGGPVRSGDRDQRSGQRSAFLPGLAEQTGYVPQTILAVPVETPQRMLGVISLLDRDPRRPGAEQDMALLSLFADQAALALASVESIQRPGPGAAGCAGRRGAADSDLVLALRQAADGLSAADADLAALAATFAALARRGAAERRLALAVLRDVAEYAERRPSRPR